MINLQTLEIHGGGAIALAQERQEPLAALSEFETVQLAALDLPERAAAWSAIQQARAAAADAELRALHVARQSWLLEQKPVCSGCSTEQIETLWPCAIALRLGAGVAEGEGAA